MPKAKASGVNAAGNYTKPSLRKKIVSQVKAAATQGTGAGQWSARKAQLVAKSGKPSSKTGERYLPEKAINALSAAEYAATTKAKRKGKAAGKQFVAQPKGIAKKTAGFR